MSIFKPQKSIFIQGPCSYFPQHKVSNEELLKIMQSSVNPIAISFSAGIHSRYWVSDEQSCSDLAIEAAKALFTLKKPKQESISQLVLSTISGDYLSPPTSPLIQYQLNLKNIGSFDLGAACAGFVVGLHISAALAQAVPGMVLLIASEVRSKFLNPKDFATSVLFGDGAAACLISQDANSADFQFIASALLSDGEVGDLVSIPAGGSKYPAAYCHNLEHHFITVKDNSALFIKAVEGMSSCAAQFLESLNIKSTDIDWIVPHQGNKHLLTAVCNNLNIPESKLVNIIAETGNTSGASVGLALDALRRKPELKKGDKILLVAAGGGGIAACSYLVAL